MARHTAGGRRSRRAVIRSGCAGIAALTAGCADRLGTGSDGSAPQAPETTAGTPTASPVDPVRVLAQYPAGPWDRQPSGELGSAFTQSTGIDVEVTHPFRTAAAQFAGLPADEPSYDLVGSTLSRLFGPWADGRFAPLSDIVDRIRDGLGEFVVDPVRLDGEVPMVPHGYRATTFQYRRDVYEDLGLEEPASLADFLANARAIHESDRTLAGYGLPGRSPGEMAPAERVKSRHEFQTYLAAMGTSPVGLRWRNPDTRDRLEVHFPESTVTALLRFFRNLSQYSTDPTAIDWNAALTRWLDGGTPEQPQIAQQLHWNNVPTVAAAHAASNEGLPTAERDRLAGIAEGTAITSLPVWHAGGVDRSGIWLSRPALDGYFLVENGRNTAGARRWLRWLYARDVDRARRLYRPPSRSLPAVQGVVGTDEYREQPFFQSWPRVIAQAETIHNTILGQQYGNVPGADLTDPVAIQVARQGFYGELVHRSVTGADPIEDIYAWGLEQLEAHLSAARTRFR